MLKREKKRGPFASEPSSCYWVSSFLIVTKEVANANGVHVPSDSHPTCPKTPRHQLLFESHREKREKRGNREGGEDKLQQRPGAGARMTHRASETDPLPGGVTHPAALGRLCRQATTIQPQQKRSAGRGARTRFDMAEKKRRKEKRKKPGWFGYS